MSQESKYYTPKIQEFYVGFEFEIKDPDWLGRDYFRPIILKDDSILEYLDAENDWMDYEHLLSYIYSDIIHGNIRVKYLDKKDIESLGFIGSTDDTNRTSILTKDTLWCIYKIILISKDIDDENPKVMISRENKDTTTEFRLFYGDIKNKSELVKLFQQLGINE